MSDSNSCPSQQILKDWANGILDDSQAAIVEDHLDLCPACDRYASKINLLHKSDLVQPPQAVIGEEECSNVLERIVSAREASSDKNADSANAAHLTLSGTKIRDYQLIRQLGRGGMGTVYLAHHTQLRKHVAVKVLRSQALQEDPDALVRFQREMRAVGKLDHPNIVRALDAGEDGGLYFLTMELIEGVDLSHLSQGKRRLSVGHACEIVRQAAIGMEYVHQQGLIHRDIKPSNMMLSCSPGQPVCVKVLDLGLALLPDTGSVEIAITADSLLIGTIEYMAPEQTESFENVDHRIDIYSLGVTLYRILTGTIPFQGPEFKNPMKRLKALTTMNPPGVASRRSDIPAALAKLVDQMIARDPAARPQSMSEVAERLRSFCPASPMMEIPDAQPNAALETTDLVNLLNRNEADTSPTACDTIIGLTGRTKSDAQTGPHRKPIVVALLAFVCALSAGMLWLKTDGAYVRVEVDSEMPLTIDVLDSATNQNVNSFRIGRGPNRFWLEAGQYRIQLPTDANDSVTLETEQLTVERGATPVIRISRIDASQQTAELSETSSSGGRSDTTGATTARINPSGWQWTPPVNLGFSLNTEWKDDQPTLSADCLMMIFSSYCIPRLTGEGDRDLWITTRAKVTDPWAAAKNLGSAINSSRKETNPAYHSPTRTLIFASNRDRGVGVGVGDMDMWLTVQADDGSWCSPTNLGPNANSEFTDDQPEISFDGLTLYFVSDRPATTEGTNIWFCTRKTINDHWGLPLELEQVNSNRNEWAPAISGDQRTLLFASDREGGFGDLDLWATTVTSATGEWSPPFNLGEQINTAALESHPAFSHDGQTLIFCSDREAGLGATDLWVTTFGSVK